ncbi:uncharacterized protein LOC131616085 [Vicia villosa]|uniref:uncharacterized protein LOC131616085 n=1 Tax=Vicia villosa TaxID=3911 RepID=UPI00273A78C0|nr:uncharacterized protein LOC131616085 [Vicia villosa]XP_058743302.1 uncharacterized protein LOC131616085 [Vicia villosa]
MSWDLEINGVFKNMNAPILEPSETGAIEEPIPIDRRNPNEDEYVDIMTCDNSGKPLIVPDQFDGGAESSGSFGDTDLENAAHDSFGDPEVESRMYADMASSSMCDDWDEDEPLRQRSKRKTTAHWRKFISPVMSRCKWTELKLRKLQSQARKYEKELAELDHEKQFDYAHLRLDGCEIKSVPISTRMHRNKVMTRKKRERVEKNCDFASYMSNHPLFAYNEKANRNVDDDRLEDCHEAAIGGDCGNMLKFELEDVWSCVGNYDNDKSWNDMIQKMIAMESQLQSLKSRHEKVISENSERFCSVNQPSDGFNHTNIKPDAFAGTASSGDGKIVPPIEDTDRPEPLGLLDYIDEDLTMYHELAKINQLELEIIGNEMINQLESIKENTVHNVNVHSTLKSCSTLKSNIPRNKRKRENISGRKKRSRMSR